MTPTSLTDRLQRTLAFGRKYSDPDGRMRDPYETEYGENFAPACFSVVAAALHRLHGRPEDLEWVGRWSRRSAAIMRESPYLREYMLGYTAMIFGLLQPSPELEAMRAEFVAASLPEEPLSPLAHILALQLVGDVLCPRGPASGHRAEKIVAELERLWTPAGFAEDRREGDDGSIPHAWVSGAQSIVMGYVNANANANGGGIDTMNADQAKRALQLVRDVLGQRGLAGRNAHGDVKGDEGLIGLRRSVYHNGRGFLDKPRY